MVNAFFGRSERGTTVAYNPAIDGLRALAVLLVVAFHCRVPGFQGGFVGVDVFFVISGFLITTLLNGEIGRTGRIDLVRFYWRRLLRLAPPLMIFLLVFALVAPHYWEQPARDYWRDAIVSALYLSDYGKAWWGVPSTLGHTWSLAIEEHFYLVWPGAMLLIARMPRQNALNFLAVAYLCFTVWRVWTFNAFGWSDAYYRFDTRLSGLTLGGLLAFLVPQMQADDRRLSDVAGVAALALLTLCAFLVRWGSASYFALFMPLVELTTAALIMAASTPGSAIAKLFARPPLVAIGLGSYALYLWHVPVSVYLRNQLDWPATLLATTIISGLAAWLTYILIERPLRDYRRRQHDAAAKPALA